MSYSQEADTQDEREIRLSKAVIYLPHHVVHCFPYVFQTCIYNFQSQSSKKETPKKKPGPKARAKKDVSIKIIYLFLLFTGKDWITLFYLQSNSKPYKSPKKNKKSKNKEDERLEEMFNFFGKKKDK